MKKVDREFIDRVLKQFETQIPHGVTSVRQYWDASQIKMVDQEIEILRLREELADFQMVAAEFRNE